MGEDMNDHDLLIRIDTTVAEMKKTLDALVPQVKELQTDRTTNQTNIKNLQDDVKALETKSDTWNTINSIGTGIAAVIATLLGFAK